MLAVCLLEQIKPSSSLLRDAVLLRFRSYRSGKSRMARRRTSDGPWLNHIGRYREIAARKSQLAPCLTSLFANYDPSAGSPPEK
jgi:hypothetical protein